MLYLCGSKKIVKVVFVTTVVSVEAVRNRTHQRCCQGTRLPGRRTPPIMGLARASPCSVSGLEWASVIANFTCQG
ncbi:MAG: hypothetical protein NVS2B7_10570 [Herpetosiphon sp.]